MKEKGYFLKRLSTGIFYEDIRLRSQDEVYVSEDEKGGDFLQPGPDEKIPFK